MKSCEKVSAVDRQQYEILPVSITFSHVSNSSQVRRYFAIRSRSSLASSPHRPRQVYCGSRLPTRFSCTVARPTHARPALRTSHFLFTLPRYVMCRYLTSRVQLRCAQPPRCSKVLCAHISRTHVPRAITLPPRASRPAFHAAHVPLGGHLHPRARFAFCFTAGC